MITAPGGRPDTVGPHVGHEPGAIIGGGGGVTLAAHSGQRCRCLLRAFAAGAPWGWRAPVVETVGRPASAAEAAHRTRPARAAGSRFGRRIGDSFPYVADR